MSTSKSSRLIQFIIRFSLTWALLYLAFIERVGGAYNLVHTLSWIACVLSLFLLTAPALEAIKNHPRDLIFKIDKVDDFVIAAVFIWFGSVATGVAWLIATIIAIIAADLAKDKLNEAD